MFELATVFVAMMLFFGGVATLFTKPRVTRGLLILATVTLGIGVVNVVIAF